jgi:hypothetical protein
MPINSSHEFQVIAEIQGQNLAGLDGIIKKLSQAFAVDFASRSEQLRRGGIPVYAARTLQDAKDRAQMVRELGADCRILDPQGRIVYESSAFPSFNPASPKEFAKTRMGGFNAPSSEPKPNIKSMGANIVDRHVSTPTNVESEKSPELAVSETILGTGNQIPTPPISNHAHHKSPSSLSLNKAPQSPSHVALPTQSQNMEELDFLPPNNTDPSPFSPSVQANAPQSKPDHSSAIAFNQGITGGKEAVRALLDLDHLNSEDLMLLDGSLEEDKKSSAAPTAQGSIDSAYYNPPLEEDSLNLDVPSVLFERNRPSDVYPAIRPTNSSSPPPPNRIDSLPKIADANSYLLTSPPEEAPTIQDQPRSWTDPALISTSAPPLSSQNKMSDRTHSSTYPAVSAPSNLFSRPKEKVAGAALFSQQVPQWLLLNGWFHQRPRLRLIIGFALALGLGSIVPTIYAHSAFKSRIYPALEDLSTAKAHGAQLSQLPNYRSPEEIQEAIGDIKWRYGIYTFTLWLIATSILGFIWFKFT